MPEVCGSAHPEDSTRTCILSGAGHADHMDKAGPWENPDRALAAEAARSTRRRKKSKDTTKSLAAEAREGKRGILEGDVQWGGTPRYTKEEGMATAATSEASADFRAIFTLAMIEVAQNQIEFSTNDVWEWIRKKGYPVSGSRQAAGTVGQKGVTQGYWEATDRKVLNQSKNGHSTDREVVVYRSKILGKNVLDDEPK